MSALLVRILKVYTEALSTSGHTSGPHGPSSTSLSAGHALDAAAREGIVGSEQPEDPLVRVQPPGHLEVASSL